MSDMLCKAQEMTEKAASFYQDAMDACHDALGAEFFKWLAEEKGRLAARMQEIGAKLGAGSSWGDACTLPDEASAGAVIDFRNKAAGRVVSGQACMAEVEALKTASDMESSIAGFYQSQLPSASEAVEKEFLEYMLGETRQHVLLVEDMLAYYEDPAAWASGMGRGELDGA